MEKVLTAERGRVINITPGMYQALPVLSKKKIITPEMAKLFLQLDSLQYLMCVTDHQKRRRNRGIEYIPKILRGEWGQRKPGKVMKGPDGWWYFGHDPEEEDPIVFDTPPGFGPGKHILNGWHRISSVLQTGQSMEYEIIGFHSIEELKREIEMKKNEVKSILKELFDL